MKTGRIRRDSGGGILAESQNGESKNCIRFHCSWLVCLCNHVGHRQFFSSGVYIFYSLLLNRDPDQPKNKTQSYGLYIVWATKITFKLLDNVRSYSVNNKYHNFRFWAYRLTHCFYNGFNFRLFSILSAIITCDYALLNVELMDLRKPNLGWFYEFWCTHS